MVGEPISKDFRIKIFDLNTNLMSEDLITKNGGDIKVNDASLNVYLRSDPSMSFFIVFYGF